MRRIIAIFLCLLLLSSCTTTPAYTKPVSFYYLATEASYDSNSSSMVSEIREGSEMGALEDILRIYLEGPVSEDLASPFPAGLKLIRIRQDSGTVYITVSQELATLTNLDLTLACGCIALTCLNLTGAECVCIDAEKSLLDGQKSITMDRNSLELTDNSARGE